jgi:hypothetical protein
VSSRLVPNTDQSTLHNDKHIQMNERKSENTTKTPSWEKLYSYQKAVIIEEATAYFCSTFLPNDPKTSRLMINSAEAGKEKIIESSKTKKEQVEQRTEFLETAWKRLFGLLKDYRRFLAERKLTEWSFEHPFNKRMKELNRTPNPTYETYKAGVENSDPEVSANVIINLIQMTLFLLRRHTESIQEQSG